MVPSRPRRAGLRRALPFLSLVVLVPLVSLSLGPVLSASPWTRSPDIVALPSPTGVPPLPSPSDVLPISSPTDIPPTLAPSPSLRPPSTPDVSADVRMGGELASSLATIRTEYAIPGVSVAITFPDGTTWAGAGGFADIVAGTPVTPDTAFALASLTKTFTSALILRLAEEGEVSLDATVRTYLPDLRIDPGITVRQLLDHTSGLADFFFDKAIDTALLAEPDRHWTEAEALEYVDKSYFEPGRGWHYSNTNYLLLGVIAARMGHAPLAEQFRQRFLGPLGLDSAFYQPTEVARGPVAHGYRFDTGATDAPPIDLTGAGPIVPFASVVTAAGGAGGLAATATDVARWARALYGGDVLGAASRQEMVDGGARTARYRPFGAYGLGVQFLDIAGQPTVGHSGRLLGFRSAVRYLPEAGITIAVLTNQSRTDPGIIVDALLRIAMRAVHDCGCRTGR